MDVKLSFVTLTEHQQLSATFLPTNENEGAKRRVSITRNKWRSRRIPVTEIVDNSTYVITFKESNDEIIQLSVEVNVHVSKCFNVKFQIIFFRASYLQWASWPSNMSGGIIT